MGGDPGDVPAARAAAEAAHRAVRSGERGPGLTAAENVAIAARQSEPLLDMKQRTTHEDPNFMETFFRASRLHYIGTWKHRYEAFLEDLPPAPSSRLRGADPGASESSCTSTWTVSSRRWRRSDGRSSRVYPSRCRGRPRAAASSPAATTSRGRPGAGRVCESRGLKRCARISSSCRTSSRGTRRSPSTCIGRCTSSALTSWEYPWTRRTSTSPEWTGTRYKSPRTSARG